MSRAARRPASREYPIGYRVQLHPGLDRWMMGDRYGEVVGIARGGRLKVKLDKSGKTILLTEDRITEIFPASPPSGLSGEVRRTYELVYSTGGHGGPYPSIREASLAAERLMRGNHNETWIAVVAAADLSQMEKYVMLLKRGAFDQRPVWESAGTFATGLSGLSGSRGAPADEDAANELVLYADNDERLYKNSWEPIARNLIRHIRRGVYDPVRAVDGWIYHADRAAQAYAKEGGASGRNWHEIFSVPTRRLAATHWARAFESAWESGELEHLNRADRRHGEPEWK